MKELYNENDVNELSERVLKSSIDKISDEISNGLYSHLETYLYEHYENAKEKVENKLISQITEQFVRDPKDYKYKELRKKIFEENKEEIVKLLSDEAIETNIEKIIKRYLNKDYYFHWMWEEGIANFIKNNIELFSDNERIQDMFAIENERLRSYIQYLKNEYRIED